MKTLLLDNNDSFTHTIIELFRTIGENELALIPSQQANPDQFGSYQRIVLSPGPGTPRDFPAMAAAIQHCAHTRTPLLGICLGQQAIGEYFGGKLLKLNAPVHGQQKTIRVDGTAVLFAGLPDSLRVGLYHSWVLDKQQMPDCLRVTATTGDGQPMALEHTELPMHALQFHPESFLTDYGQHIILNFLAA